MERTLQRNRYRWIPHVNLLSELRDLEEERCQLEKEERKLDAWIRLQTASVEELRQMCADMDARDGVQKVPGVDGEMRACKSPCKETTRKVAQGDTADTAKKNHVDSPSVTPGLSLDTTEPVLSRLGGQRKVHCLATLAKRFRRIVTVSNEFSALYHSLFHIQLTMPKI